MKDMWRSDPCYADYGVDGTSCSFFIYLSEVSLYKDMYIHTVTEPGVRKAEKDKKALWLSSSFSPHSHEYLFPLKEELPAWIGC